MAFRVTTEPVTAGGQMDTTFVLANAELGVRAEVWPKFGLNLLRWSVAAGDVLYCDPAWDSNPVATRSGHPILFPFPNRMEHGKFSHAGVEYQLPLNETSGKHAIHGFTPKRAWRVLGTGTEKDHAYLTGQFQLSVDAPEVLACWPGDMALTLTYRLFESALEVTGFVENLAKHPVPFGLGYHPYFTIPGFTDSADELLVQAKAKQLWPLVSGIPTGERTSIPPEVDFNTERAVGAVELDTLYTGLPPGPSQRLRDFATLSHGAHKLTVKASAEFRELLLFTPPHRKAVAIEPYTCANNGMNLPNAGWLTLPAGGTHASTVRYELSPRG
jgi:aldose 1-epimerase